MALKITFTPETQADLLIYLNFESAANGDTGREAALAALSSSYTPSAEYPTLDDAQAALISARTVKANDKAAKVLIDYSVAHAKRIARETAEAAKIAQLTVYDARIDALAAESLSAIVVEVVEP